MAPTKYDFAGKVALVTGSSSGIGEAIAIQLAQNGAKVTITGRDAKALAKVASEIEKISGHQPLQVVGDLTKDAELPKKLVEETVAKFGQLDVLVNNAGGGAPDDTALSDRILDNYDEVFQLNVRSVVDLTHQAVPHLEKTKGNIVNISSIAAMKPFSVIYSMSKAALDMFTKAAAQDFGVKGIRINSVNPGPVVTQIFRSFGVEVTDEMRAQMSEMFKKMTIIDKMAQPVEIANLVSFLASDDAGNITGACFVSDTGSLAKKAF